MAARRPSTDRATDTDKGTDTDTDTDTQAVTNCYREIQIQKHTESIWGR